jgi:hypothetical protein
LEEGVVGRAIGLFLLVVGIGLAAYGLPTSEADRLAKLTGLGPGISREQSVERVPEATADDRSRAIEERSRANGAMTRPRNASVAPQPMTETKTSPSVVTHTVAGQTTSVDAGATVAPMEKLRAAANARAQAAAEETVGSLRPLSLSTTAETAPPVPRPVEISSAMRPVLPVPSVVNAARREASARAVPSAGAPPTAKSGWTTSVAAGPAGVATPTQLTTIAVPAGPRSETSVVKEAAVNAGSKTRNDSEDKQDKAITLRERNELAEAKPSKPAPRVQVAQRHTPPVYLGRPAPSSYTYTYTPSLSSGFPSAVNNSGPKQRFRSQDMWENQRRNGM